MLRPTSSKLTPEECCIENLNSYSEVPKGDYSLQVEGQRLIENLSFKGNA